MNIYHILGWIMVSIPFIILFAYVVKESGWKSAFLIFSIFIGIVLFLALGCYLTGL